MSERRLQGSCRQKLKKALKKDKIKKINKLLQNCKANNLCLKKDQEDLLIRFLYKSKPTYRFKSKKYKNNK